MIQKQQQNSTIDASQQKRKFLIKQEELSELLKKAKNQKNGKNIKVTSS